MKSFLFLDSSNIDLIVAFLTKEKVIDFVQYEAWQRQSENMIPEINNLMEKNHIKKEDIEGIIVTIGPGSYTGIRIALTIAKIMSLALGCKVYPISSLWAMADFTKPSIALINARSERSYIGVFDKDKVILNDQIMTNEDAIKYINEHKDFEVFGDLEYLGFSNKKNKIFEQILSILPFLKEAENSLFIKPIYLKENYDTKQN